MTNNDLSFEDFIKNVNPLYQQFARQACDYLLQNGCRLKLRLSKNGYIVSFQHVKSKRGLLNFTFRKNGLVARVYGDNVNKYMAYLDTLPDTMIKSIEKATVCKMSKSRCPKGYVFTVKGAQHQKCRYKCFMFAVNHESIPFITAFLEHELRERDA